MVSPTVEESRCEEQEVLAWPSSHCEYQTARSRCDGEVRRELLGHSGKDINETVYLRLSVLKTLSENLEKVDFTI